MDSKKIIMINLIFVALMAISGISFGLIGNSKSLLTDGIVSLVVFSSSSVGILIHSILNTNDDYLYPFGKWRFEYVYDFIRLMILTIIILYSLFEATHQIFIFWQGSTGEAIPNYNSFILYFPIKLILVGLSLTWLHHRKSNLDDEYYHIERDSVLVDGLLTIAILIGFTVFTRIAAIAPVADSITLIIISLILLITIYSELKHLVFILIGKRIYTDLELQLTSFLTTSDYLISDIHIEKFGLVYIVFITCSFTGTRNLQQLTALEAEVGQYLDQMKISKYRIELNFK